jgi:hypothetical protein
MTGMATGMAGMATYYFMVQYTLMTTRKASGCKECLLQCCGCGILPIGLRHDTSSQNCMPPHLVMQSNIGTQSIPIPQWFFFACVKVNKYVSKYVRTFHHYFCFVRHY